MLQCSSPGEGTRFCRTAVSRSRNCQGCGPSVHHPVKVSLWVELYWVLLGLGEEIPLGQLWLYIWHLEGEPAKGIGVSSTLDNSEVAALCFSVDGGLQKWDGNWRHTKEGEGIQLQNIHFTSVCSWDSYLHFWSWLSTVAAPKYICFLLNFIRTLVQLRQALKGTSNSHFMVSQCLFLPPGALGEGIHNHPPN